jgi:hypothetical protein
MKSMTRPTLGLTLLAIALAAPACTTSTGGGGTYAATTDAGAGADGSAGGGSGGDSTKNKATIAAKDDDGATTEVKADKPADKGDAEAKSLGATNADKMLQLYIADASGTLITAFIDTEKHALPAKGIAVGEVNSDVFVTYAGAGAILNSKAGGSIDIDVCPTKAGEPVTGRFSAVVVVNEGPVGPAKLTLDGPFNLVYFGGAGAIACTPPASGGGGGGGKVDVGTLGKPAGASCDANPCDGGNNSTRNCCPYVPCVEPCLVKCANEAQTCFTGCGFDFDCPVGCQSKFVACSDACADSCNVDATCKAALGKLNQCEEANDAVCSDSEDAEVCSFDKCCAEWKAAF